MKTVTRIKTGITEFDGMLKGGFLPGDAVMVAGSAGTGKTTLALQYLINGIKQSGEGGIYVTFEQFPEQIYRDAENFGWNLRKLELENKFRLILTSPNLLLGDKGDSILDEPIKEVQARRIVLDSLSHFQMFIPQGDMRMEVYRLVNYLKKKGLSSLLLWETPQILGQTLSLSEVGLSFLVDCIVFLRLAEIQSTMRNALVVLKMRGSSHDKRLREYEITSDGIKVGAPFSEYEAIITGSPRRSSFAEGVSKWSKALTGER